MRGVQDSWPQVPAGPASVGCVLWLGHRGAGGGGGSYTGGDGGGGGGGCEAAVESSARMEAMHRISHAQHSN